MIMIMITQAVTTGTFTPLLLWLLRIRAKNLSSSRQELWYLQSGALSLVGSVEILRSHWLKISYAIKTQDRHLKYPSWCRQQEVLGADLGL